MQNILRNCYTKICQENCNSECENIKIEIVQILEVFDCKWTKFEQLYVNELMIIEKDARRFIYAAIDLEQQLQSAEIREKLKGKILLNSPDYLNLRKNLCGVISKINSVANVDGKGRDDLEPEILLESDNILRKISKEQSQAVRNLADKIRSSFIALREIFRKYEKNIEMVDPQLKNNPELVEALFNYENSWEKGKVYFLDQLKLKALIYCSHTIETLSEKYLEFKEQVECREADIFVSIPSIFILKKLDNDDKNICLLFLPALETHSIFITLKNDFIEWKKRHGVNYSYYNIIEKIILNIPLNEKEKIEIGVEEKFIEQILHRIKQLSMELQRNNPLDWNSFLDSALL